jgi:transcription termination/antitermination protein NusA
MIAHGRTNLELLQAIEALARDKGIEREEVIVAMEAALQKAAKARFGNDRELKSFIDRKTGEMKLALCYDVVDVVEDFTHQILLKDAKKKDPDIEVGGQIFEYVPNMDFGRIIAQTAKQVILQKVREAERQRQYNEFKDRLGEIINGVVRRVEFGNLTVDLGRSEAILRRDELIPRETFRQGDRIRAYIYDVRNEPRGHQIFLSRTHPHFMAKLFAQEVPEVYDGVIEIKSVARDPGSRAKIAVYSKDSSLDPVGACVGMRGSRVQAVVNELQGEKVDIVIWSQTPSTFVINALSPSHPTKVVLDEDAKRIEVVVPDDELSLAIGRRGQNVRLASILTGWDIDVMTETQESERRTEDFKKGSEMFIQALDVDEVIAQLLVVEGYLSIEELLEASIEELAAIEGFDIDVAEELQTRAEVYLKEEKKNIEKVLKNMGLSKDFLAFEEVSAEIKKMLGEKGVKTLDDLADLATDELLELLPNGELTHEQAETIIMAARQHWFDKPLKKTKKE